MSSCTLSADDRSELLLTLEREGHRTIYACNQCGKCSASCPFSFSPQLLMRYLQLGQVESALESPTTWVCASCMTCSRVCPKDVDPAGVVQVLRGVGSSTSVNGTLAAFARRQHRRFRHQLRSFFFANIHDISRRGSRLAPLSNWLSRVPGSRLVAHHVLGIHRERSLPAFARPSFPEWFEHHVPLGDGVRGDVVLFHDTFMDYDAPKIGVAATELLELAGYRVVLSDSGCCGRPMISKGYVGAATRCARDNVERLHEQLAGGALLVGCEPSCLLTVRHEYPRMLAGTELEAKAREVAGRCRLVDEFLAQSRDDEQPAIEFEPPNGRQVLFHGHCQQKAEADPERSLELLRLAGYDAEMVAAPCCGMAGAFGFEREHYEASHRAFERALGPALAARPEARLVVMGISCRKQIEHFAGRPALHLTEALREATATVNAFAGSPPSR